MTAESAEMKSITNDSRVVLLNTIISALEIRTGELRTKLELNRTNMTDETYEIFNNICKKCESPDKIADVVTTALNGFFERLHQTIPVETDRFEWLGVSQFPNDPMNTTQIPNQIHPNQPDDSAFDKFYTPESFTAMVRQYDDNDFTS